MQNFRELGQIHQNILSVVISTLPSPACLVL